MNFSSSLGKSQTDAEMVPLNRRMSKLPVVPLERDSPADDTNQKTFFRPGLLAVAIVLITLLTYYIPVMQSGFIWDDDAYLTENRTIRSNEGLGEIWLKPGSTPQYYPLVFSTFWVEYRLWGLNPKGYHLVNVLLHALAALMLWRVLSRLKVPGAWLAAAVFALHPVQVESVVWVTERKNLLSGLFYFSSTLCLIRFFNLDSEGEDSHRQWLWYGSGLLLFICALLSKTVTCSLPAAMVLLLWWKRGRVCWRDLLALVPFFLLGLSLGLLTAWLEQHHVGAQGLEWELTSVERILVAGRALWFYAGKLVWPAKLTFNYPRWQINAGVWWQYAYPFGVLLMLTLLWIFRSRVGRGPLVGMLFFCGTLFPALGFLDVYPFRYSYVADHFQYLASPGLIVMAVAGLTQVVSRLSPWSKRAGMALGLAVLLVLAVQTLRQSYVYENLETLWRDTLEKNPASWMAHYNLGILLAEQGKTSEAIDHYNKALQVKTDYVNIYINLGVALAKQGRLEEAIGHYHQALQIMPDHPNAHNNLGNALARQGKVEEAASHYLEALRIKPNHAEAHYNLGLLLAEQGKVEQAISHYSEVLRITPNHLDAHINLGVELAKQGRLQEAVSHFSKALQIKPDDTKARRNLELALQLMGKSPQTKNAERKP